MDIFSSKVNMLMSLRTQKKRTRTKRLWLLRSVVHCYVMNFVYNQKRCTLLRHELCLQSEALYIVTSWTLFTIRSVAMYIVTSWTLFTIMMIARRSKNYAHFLRTRADTRTLALLPTRILLLHHGLLKELLGNSTIKWTWPSNFQKGQILIILVY